MQARVLGSNVEVQIYTRAGIIVENEITKTNTLVGTIGLTLSLATINQHRLFEVSRKAKQGDATRCVDVLGIKESFYLGCGVELCLSEVSHNTKRCASMCTCFLVQGELWIPAASHLGGRQLRAYVCFDCF